jgi:uncharacterized membrane protein YfcA
MAADILVFALIGFVAQVVDGALGMAFGVIATLSLLSLGIAPAPASAAVHAAEVVTTGLSGLAHLYHRNVDAKLFGRLAVPGALGAILGAYVLTELPGESIRPFVAAYLGVMGLLILYRMLRPKPPMSHVRPPLGLGFIGGLLDAIGGGGWGPIVVSNLIAKGTAPRYAIGSVNLAEFFVTLGAAATFVMSIGLDHAGIVLGLLVGAAPAALFSAYLASRLPASILMAAVAVGVIALAVFTIGWAGR